MVVYAILAALSSALWTTDRVPVDPGADPRVFLARGPVQGSSQVFILRENRIEWFSPGMPDTHRGLDLPDDTRAFDIADADGDGTRELIAIGRESIYRIGMDPIAPPTELFPFDSILAERPAGIPLPTVLVATHENRPVLALPGRDTFELRHADGTLVLSIPTGLDAPKRIRFRKPFTVWNIVPPQVGPPDAIEGYADLVLESQPDLPSSLESGFRVPAGAGSSPAARMLDVADAHVENWPWFAVNHSDAGSIHSLYALAPPEFQDTLLRIRRVPPPSAPSRPNTSDAGPPRTYPGRIIPPVQPTDFNGDSFADVLFWSAPDPLLEWGRLSKLAATGKWPLRITLHHFSARNTRYEPQPAALLQMEVPIAWLFELRDGLPVRNFIATDLDGDSRGDVALSYEETTLTAWLSGEGGLPSEPTASVDFGEPITGIIFAQALEPAHGATICVRTEAALHFLAPAGE